MKQRGIILSVIVLVILLIIIIPIFTHSAKKHKNELKITTAELDNCTGVYEEYYELVGRKVYTHCLDEIYYNADNETNCQDKNCRTSLKEFFKEESNRGIDKIANYMTLEEELKDGGSKIYVSKKKTGFSNIDLKMIVCDTIKGDISIHLGPLDMENNLCNN